LSGSQTQRFEVPRETSAGGSPESEEGKVKRGSREPVAFVVIRSVGEKEQNFVSNERSSPQGISSKPFRTAKTIRGVSGVY